MSSLSEPLSSCVTDIVYSLVASPLTVFSVVDFAATNTAHRSIYSHFSSVQYGSFLLNSSKYSRALSFIGSFKLSLSVSSYIESKTDTKFSFSCDFPGKLAIFNSILNSTLASTVICEFRFGLKSQTKLVNGLQI